MGPPESETPDLAGTGSSVEEEMAGRAKSGSDDNSGGGNSLAETNVAALSGWPLRRRRVRASDLPEVTP